MPRPSLRRRCLAEAFATFALVFAGCGAIVADTEDAADRPVGIAVVFGLVIMVMIYATGHVSGAHINPAVTIAFPLTRHFPPPRRSRTSPAQLAGAIGGGRLLRRLARNAGGPRCHRAERSAAGRRSPTSSS